ncbi:prepilin-type N-terminal cleavage/methylation domain-containing protein [Proteiniborus ethanoligenes]|uniref:Prepilin-type N-terminal cleavage/methylation domain-containing protein n=1 Tax=Proteiniborus ethanoligenes TaxID=415015 RepID=A0A1H3K6B7_9FIRM|nr:vWA domain-containing protein [Proteiniborus ethanoligenes]SDY47711.1 prepilin-type N-terminal cleavage/methylation domain-containing protein [Proteiniborus ethanoligenes]
MKRSKGFTLIELTIVLGLIGIIIGIGFTLFNFGNKAHKMSAEEYQIQSEMRIASAKINNYLRYSTAVFTLPELNEDKLTEGWNYLALSEDNKEIVEYIYDPNTKSHKTNVIVSAQEKLSYNLNFKKENPYYIDKLLKFTLEGFIEGDNKKITIDSEVEALNALQVIDRGTKTSLSTVLAFRDDDRPLAAEAAIAMVLDKSGSMDKDLKGNTTYNADNKRTTLLRKEANRLIENFSEMQNIYLSLIPFSTSANFPVPYDNSRDFFNVYEKKSELQSKVTGENKTTDFLYPNGGTNTGDGMRRAYYKINEFNNDPHKKDIDKLNYMVILVDGVTTFASVISNTNRSYLTTDGNIKEGYLDRTDPRDLNGQVVGNGSTLDTKGTEYVKKIGKMIKDDNIKVYVVGFSSISSELDSVNDIAAACGAVKAYKAGDEEELANIFEEIRQDILRDLWHISGPQ